MVTSLLFWLTVITLSTDGSSLMQDEVKATGFSHSLFSATVRLGPILIKIIPFFESSEGMSTEGVCKLESAGVLPILFEVSSESDT